MSNGLIRMDVLTGHVEFWPMPPRKTDDGWTVGQYRRIEFDRRGVVVCDAVHDSGVAYRWDADR